ncbi:MAG: efflux transporter outer membrane subunit [Pacificimonas sp.]
MNRYLPLIALLLAGCAVGPDYERPKIETPANITTLPDAPELRGPEVDLDWWRRFDDPLLNELVAAAIRENRDVRAASARIEQARALRAIAAGAGLPNLSGDAGFTRSKQSENAFPIGALGGGQDMGGGGAGGGGQQAQTFGIGEPISIWQLSLGASWEPDLFGRVGRRVEAADARLGVAAEDRNAIWLTVLADTVQNYAELRTAQAQAAVARENIEIAARTRELTELLVEQELAPEFDLVRARADERAARADLQPFEIQIRANNAALAELTAQFPMELFSRVTAEIDTIAFEGGISAGVPSELLRRRPDVRRAERRLAAETADIGAEIADLYPSFSLTGMFGFSAMALDMLFDSGSEQWSIGGALNWPMFSGGRSRSEVDEARAGAEEARALYEGAIYGAFADADRALSNYALSQRQLNDLRGVVADRQRAFDLAELRYRSGLDSLLTLLETQRQLLAARQAFTAAEGRAKVAIVGAYRALGGGWQVTPESDAAVPGSAEPT